MRLTRARLWVVAGGVALAVLAAPVEAQQPVTAFVDVSVIPMDRERVLAHQTVIVQGDRIVALGPAARVQVPAAAARIDGRGKFLMPGLADMHAHPLFYVPGLFWVSQDPNPDTLSAAAWAAIEELMFLEVANGVTTLRDLWGDPVGLALRARIAAGTMLGPRLYVGRRPGPFAAESAATTPVLAKAAGYDLVKLYGVDGAELDSLSAGARRVGIPIAGHVPGSWTRDDPTAATATARALRAGYASMEHLIGFIDGFDRGQWLLDPAQLPAIGAAIRRAGVWVCPTLAHHEATFGYFTDDTLATWPEMRYVSGYTPRRDVHDSAFLARQQRAREGTVNARRVVKALHDAGVGLLLGTDDAASRLHIQVPPGFYVHRELVALVEAGLTPYEALVTGTRNVAAYFGTLDSTGTVAVGKRADLILLAGNPLRDIRQTQQRAGVMVGGHWLPQAEIERRLATLTGAVGRALP